MTPTDEIRGKLRALRDRLAAELPRARIRAGAPPDLAQRLQTALDLVSGVYLLGLSTAAPAPAGLGEAREDALVEGHLALHEWERWAEQEKLRAARRIAPASNLRQSERHETNVLVKLLRYTLQDGGSVGMTLESETANRPARNVSLGGIFVSASPEDLPRVGPGCVLHVSVSFGALSFKARATVIRRDGNGFGLRWVEESDRIRTSVESLLDAIRGARTEH